MIMSKELNPNLEGWHRNTALCCDLKTLLHSDTRMKTGKQYVGILRRDTEIEDYRYDEHYTFTEAMPWTGKRNPRVFRGKYISITRRDDGTLCPNFRPLRIDEDFSPERYATDVSNELLWALEGFVGKG